MGTSGFKPMKRRPEREISREEAIDILKQGEYGVLSLAHTENGYPYGVPINYIYDSNKLYFHCGNSGQKLDIIRTNPRACFTVVLDAQVLPKQHSTSYRSVIVFGRCSLVEKELKDEILLKFGLHFAAEYPEEIKKNIVKLGKVTEIIQFEIEHLTGKRRKLE